MTAKITHIARERTKFAVLIGYLPANRLNISISCTENIVFGRVEWHNSTEIKTKE